MQIKMATQFNPKEAKKIFFKEFNFISDIFEKMPMPSHNSVDEDNEVEGNEYNKDTALYSNNSNKTTRAQTYEELKSRLNNLKGNKKLDYQQKLLKKKLKNRITRNLKRKERLMQKKLAMTESNAAGGSAIKNEDGEVQKVSKPKPVFNSEGHMVFSKFDFSEIGTKKRPNKVEKNPKKILEQLQEKKKAVKELEEAGEKQIVQEIKEKDAWKAALAKTSGEKVKDDPELLKRTIKRKEHHKKRSAKKWENRTANVEKAIQERQEKRQDNILKRKKDKRTNKLKKSAKRGRIIPGF